MSIEPQKIRELRETTGAGFLDCKLALERHSGDIEKAIAWLRKEGLSKAIKKLGRNALCGIVAVLQSLDRNRVSMVEFNTETDFVARNEKFQRFASEITELALSCESLSALEEMRTKSGLQVKDEVLAQMSSIGEKIKVSRMKTIVGGEGKTIGFYVHNQIGPSMGNVAAIAVIEPDKLEDLAQKISAHVAAMAPLYTDPQQVPQEVISKEVEGMRDEKALVGKPEAIVQKILQNKINQFKESISLNTQEYALDEGITFGEFLAGESKEVGSQIKVLEFHRFSVGGS